MNDFDDEQQKADLEQEIKELRAQRNRASTQLAKEKLRTAELIEAVYSAASASAQTVPPVPKPPKDRRKKDELAGLLHLTDWQLGKETSSYNVEVGRQRIEQQVWDQVQTFTEGVRSHTPLKHLTIALGGDMVEGTLIFPGQAYEITTTLFDQLFAVVETIKTCVTKALELYETVTVVEEWGNHGRIGRRGEGPAQDNVDRMAYKIAAEHFNDPRLTWQTHTSFVNKIKIGNYTALLAHGDEIKSYGGNLPAYGIVRKCNAWQAGAADFRFQDAYLGHFHTPMTLGMSSGNQIFVTGSPESDNEYAKEFVGATGNPSQRFHIINPTEGKVVQQHILWLN